VSLPPSPSQNHFLKHTHTLFLAPQPAQSTHNAVLAHPSLPFRQHPHSGLALLQGWTLRVHDRRESQLRGRGRSRSLLRDEGPDRQRYVHSFTTKKPVSLTSVTDKVDKQDCCPATKDCIYLPSGPFNCVSIWIHINNETVLVLLTPWG
jgi:hypothetical protein